MTEKNETEAEFEARMIARFNAKVNADQSTELTLPVKSSVDLQSATENSKKQPIAAEKKVIKSVEVGGPKGLEPTRYGDWEAKGRCHDF